MRRRAQRFAILLSLLLFAPAAFAQSESSERPSTMKLFPEETVLFIRFANAQEFGERLRETALGRMIRDPQLKDFVDQLYGDVEQLYSEEVEDKLGVTWEDLKNLPRGEVAFGIVATPEGRPAFVLFVDQGDEPSVADNFVERALEVAEERGSDIADENIGGVDVVVVRDPERERRMIGIFERDNVIVAATNADVIRGLLYHWNGGKLPSEDASENAAPAEDGEPASAGDDDGARDAAAKDNDKAEEKEFVPGRTLAENDRFSNLLKQCRRPQDPPPHALFFVDPIELARALGRRSGGVQFVMGILPAIGLDGLLGVGGTITYAADQYDDMTHLHLLLENPRAGVLQLPSFEAGDTTPQPFVPHQIESFITWTWSPRTTYDRIVALVDKYRYEGSVDKIVKERISDKLGVDFVTAVLDNLTGRFTWLIGYERPAKLQQRQQIMAAEVKDAAAAAESLKTVMAKYPDMFQERQFGEVTYYAILPEELKEQPEEERQLQPFIGIMDGYVFFGTSCQVFEQCIAARDGTAERLVDSEDYARARDVLGKESAGATPAMFSVTRAEEAIRQWYEMLLSEKTREMIDENKENNKFLTALADALDQNKLPPFEVLAPYFAPGGAVLYDTDNGYHFIGFTLRDEAEAAAAATSNESQ